MSGAAQPRLDVEISVICTDNWAALEGCLESVPAACDGLRWRLTVIDNASTDGTSDHVRERYPWAALIRHERRHGFGANHNLILIPVVAENRARYALILNDDTRFDPGAVRELVAAADADDELGAMGPALRGTNGRPQQSFFTFPTPWSMVLGHLVPGRRSSPPETDGWLNGSCILFRVAALREVGPLDDRFFIFYEDTEICLRLLRHGWRSSVCPAAGMIHLEHQTVSQPATGSVMARQMLRSQWLYVRKENGRARALGVAAGTRTALALRAAKALVSRSVTPDGKPLAPQLGRLAAYAPKRPLPHEDQTAS